MTHDVSLGDSAELAALYAAGALTGAECAAFEAHLDTGCPDCLAEVRQYGPVVAALAAAVSPVVPPSTVRDQLLRRVAAGTAPAASPLRRHLHASSPRHELLIQRGEEGTWEDTAVPGARLRVLFVDRDRNQFTALVRMAPGTSYPRHVHAGPEECLVLEGDLHVGDTVLRAGDYQRAPAGSAHGVQSTEEGCLLYITSSLTDEFV